MQQSIKSINNTYLHNHKSSCLKTHGICPHCELNISVFNIRPNIISLYSIIFFLLFFTSWMRFIYSLYRNKETRNQCCVVDDDNGLVHDLGHALVTVIGEKLYFTTNSFSTVLARVLYHTWNSWQQTQILMLIQFLTFSTCC